VLRRRHLGRVSFVEANDLQRALLDADDDYLLVMEHPPTYTCGIRTRAEHFLVDPATLDAVVVDADRGGDVTYHGPGQLVAWAIRTVGDDPSAGPDHVRALEDGVIEAVRASDATGALGTVGRLDGYPGVWARLETVPHKIAAVGVRTERDGRGRRRTLHGVALNVTVDLAAFKAIVPCGIPDKPVGSLRTLGVNTALPDVETVLGRAVAAQLSCDVSLASVDRSPAALDGERPLLRRLRRAGVNPDASLALRERKPEWLRVPAHMGSGFQHLRAVREELGLVTVCEEAGCPNIFECWAEGTATFMVNGERCTRACGFCLVDTRKPLALDPDEPAHVAEAVRRLDLAHAVITCVARDDLADGGANAIADSIRAIRRARPGTAVEVLVSDFRGDAGSLRAVIDAHPDVLNHNVETVPRLQRAVRPSAGYARSLTVLARGRAAGLTTKSGFMVGLGEDRDEVVEVLADLAAIGVSIVTIGQYLRPSEAHLPVARWWRPEEFDELADVGRSLGIDHVQASPLTRSSYHARESLAASTPVVLRSAPATA
jgi:lipoyl synthase